MKKIVDIPESATEFSVVYYAITSTGGKSIFGTDSYVVNDLPDLPTVAENVTVEKRVIELPADVIAHVKWAKEYDGSTVLSFLERLEIANKFEKELRPHYPDDLADWYLHPKLVEFVPKKEPEFVVMLPVGQWYRLEPAYYMRDDKGLNSFIAIIDRALRMSEEEADKLAGGLEAFNARKVKVED